MTKKTCQVKITDSLDVKEFTRLMKNHNIDITKKEDINNSVIFSLNEKDEVIEEIMIYTQLSWSFN